MMGPTLFLALTVLICPSLELPWIYGPARPHIRVFALALSLLWNVLSSLFQFFVRPPLTTLPMRRLLAHTILSSLSPLLFCCSQYVSPGDMYVYLLIVSSSKQIKIHKGRDISFPPVSLTPYLYLVLLGY
jgi:hypothetical protein